MSCLWIKCDIIKKGFGDDKDIGVLKNVSMEKRNFFKFIYYFKYVFVIILYVK